MRVDNYCTVFCEIHTGYVNIGCNINFTENRCKSIAFRQNIKMKSDIFVENFAGVRMSLFLSLTGNWFNYDRTSMQWP